MRDYNNHNSELMVLPFVWHVSYVVNDFHIALQGILPGKKDHVFANNHFHSLKKMWPIPMDSWDYMDETEDVYLTYYTFWRIDTSILNCEWSIDENLDGESSLQGLLHRTKYIKTRSAIPASAILPFKYAHGEVPSMDISEHDGVISIGGLTQGLPLILDQELVDWKEWREKNQL
jgi:hypothetical protein